MGVSADLIEGSRALAYSRIVSALVVGEYPTATLLPGTTPSPWGLLRMLEARLVALDLLGGGAGSVSSAMAGDNFKHWKTALEATLTAIENKQVSIVNDVTGQVVSGVFPQGGMVSDERDTDITLDDPATWPDADPLERWDD